MTKEYKVGYRKPPTKARFKKGKSGNPSGRPKGVKNLKSDLQEELRGTILVTVNGRQRKITKQRALIKRLTADAIGGNVRSLGLILNLVLAIERVGDLTPEDSSTAEQDATILQRHIRRLKGYVRGGHSDEE